MKPLKIAGLKLKNPYILAPMAGVCCNAFRLLCKEYGAGLVFSGQIEEDKLLFNPKRADDFIKEERPIAAQLLGKNPDKLIKCAEILKDKVDIIDFNTGCPKSGIIARGDGAAFLNNLELLSKILSKLREHCTLPLTVKTRIGTDKSNITMFKVLKVCEDIGIDAITLHARFVSQGYSGKADHNYTKMLKEKSDIPVIANGDITNLKEADSLLEFCDGAMIGRAAIGNPFVFCSHIPTADEKIAALLRLIRHYKKYSGRKFIELRQHSIWFMKSARNSRIIKEDIKKLKNEEELKSYLLNICQQ